MIFFSDVCCESGGTRPPSCAFLLASSRPDALCLRIIRSSRRVCHRFAGADGGGGSSSSGEKADPLSWVFDNEHIIGNGSFGVVYQAVVRQTQKEVAIKKVLQDKRFKNRELQIMRMLDHTNVTTLLHYFYTEGEKNEETYTNLVMDFVPQTVYSMSRQYAKAKKPFPTLFMKLYTYQLCRSLAYIHSGRLPPRHQAAEPARPPGDARAQAVRLWLGEDPGQGSRT